MHDTIDIGTLVVDRKVKHDFASALAFASKLHAFGIDAADIFRLHVAFGYHRWCAQVFAFIQANGDVAIIRSRESAVIDAATDFAHLFLEFVFGLAIV